MNVNIRTSMTNINVFVYCCKANANRTVTVNSWQHVYLYSQSYLCSFLLKVVCPVLNFANSIPIAKLYSSVLGPLVSVKASISHSVTNIWSSPTVSKCTLMSPCTVGGLPSSRKGPIV